MSSVIYMNVLEDSLQKKKGILEDILSLTKTQETIMRGQMSKSDFMDTIRRKQLLIDNMQQLDNGFQIVYDRVKQELESSRSEYQDQIVRLQKMISDITELSVEIQALEMRNHAKLDQYIEEHRQEIKEKRLNNSAANNYYQNMIQYDRGASYFMDKKK